MAAPYSYKVTGDGPFDDDNYEILSDDGSVIAVTETRGVAEALIMGLLLCNTAKFSKKARLIEEEKWYSRLDKDAPVEDKGYVPAPFVDEDDDDPADEDDTDAVRA